MANSGQMCGIPPTIEDLAKSYGLMSIAQLFKDKAQDVEVASVKGVTIKELGLENADCVIRFSYLPEFKHPSWSEESKEGFSLTLLRADNEEFVTSSVHCLSETMTGRFNYSSGSTPSEGFENLQFTIDNLPQDIIGFTLNGTALTRR